MISGETRRLIRRRVYRDGGQDLPTLLTPLGVESTPNGGRWSGRGVFGGLTGARIGEAESEPAAEARTCSRAETELTEIEILEPELTEIKIIQRSRFGNADLEPAPDFVDGLERPKVAQALGERVEVEVRSAAELEAGTRTGAAQSELRGD